MKYALLAFAFSMFALLAAAPWAAAEENLINLDTVSGATAQDYGTGANFIKASQLFYVNSSAGVTLTHIDISEKYVNTGTGTPDVYLTIENGTRATTWQGTPIKGCTAKVSYFSDAGYVWKNYTFPDCDLQSFTGNSDSNIYYIVKNTSTATLDNNQWRIQKSDVSYIGSHGFTSGADAGSLTWNSASGDFAMRVWGEPAVSPTLIIINPSNITYYDNNIILNVSNSSEIHSFWIALNNTNVTYLPPYTSPNGTYPYPYNGVFNLTIYGNKTTYENYSDSEFFTVRSYNIVYYNWPAKTVETKNGMYNISVLDQSGTSSVTAALFLNGTYRGYTSLTTQSNYYNFTFIGIPPNLQGQTNDTNITGTWEVRINGTFIDSTVTNISFSYYVERLRFLPCAAPMQNSTINFSIFDEQNSSMPVMATNFDIAAVSLYIDNGGRNYSYALGSNYSFLFCIFPGWVSSYTMNATIKYVNSSYNDRWRWEEGRAMTNTTENVTLYMVSSDISIIPAYSVLDLFQSPQSNVIIQAWRLFVGENIYKRVADGKTNNEGVADLPLKPDELYVYKIYRGGKLLVSWGPDLLSADTTTRELFTESGSFSDFWKYRDRMSGACRNVSSTMICDFSDASGLAVLTSLHVSAFMDALNNTQKICITNSTLSSGSMLCDFTGYENRTIQYTMYVTLADGTKILIANDFLISAAPLLELGNSGLFASFIIILAMSLIGLSMPSTGISGPLVLGYIGMVASWWLGLLVVPIIVIAGFGFAIAALAFILTTKGGSG